MVALTLAIIAAAVAERIGAVVAVDRSWVLVGLMLR
jgi:hypothetical protein